ncbi:MAG: hypothetical protein H0X33_14925 [Taibaiella sp.]|nr:hypothetical protein [Taibaiella sp.]
MGMNQHLIAELKNEAASTRKMLERVPLDKADWKPHDKSMTLGRLATHVAELPTWVGITINTDELDLGKNTNTPTKVTTNEELVALHDKNVNDAVAALESASDEHMKKSWKLLHNGHTIFEMPKAAVVRSFSLSHLYHHRGQLSVYLRLNDVPVPGMYGPSADDKN